MSVQGFIRHPILERCGVLHGFGTRDSDPPRDAFAPRQVHGTHVHRCVAEEDAPNADGAIEADAVCSTVPGRSIAIVTADCVPILASTASGSGVLAVHAGWRGLSNGVIENGIGTLRGATSDGEEIVAVVGPHVGACCYEVDGPVLDAMVQRFGEASVARASTSTRPGHARLALGALALLALERAGVARASCARTADRCTSCETERFHSFRRDGARAGRMTHFIATPYR